MIVSHIFLAGHRGLDIPLKALGPETADRAVASWTAPVLWRFRLARLHCQSARRLAHSKTWRGLRRFMESMVAAQDEGWAEGKGNLANTESIHCRNRLRKSRSVFIAVFPQLSFCNPHSARSRTVGSRSCLCDNSLSTGTDLFSFNSTIRLINSNCTNGDLCSASERSSPFRMVSSAPN